MKKILILFILSGGSLLGINAQNDSGYTFEVETPGYEGSIISHNYKPEWNQRFGQMKATVFNISYGDPDNWDVSKRRAIEYAAKLWEEQLETCYPQINLRVKFYRPTPTSKSITKTNINYYYNVISDYGYENLLYPASTVKKYVAQNAFLNSEAFAEIETDYRSNIDIEISFSNASDLFYWGVDGETPGDKYDFVTVALREIAKGLGVVSGVTKKSQGFTHLSSDNHSTRHDKKLGITEYAPFSDQLTGYIQNANGYINSPAGVAPIYAPLVYEPGISLNYVHEQYAKGYNAELLKRYLAKGESIHVIGSGVIDILLFLEGWTHNPAVGGGTPDNHPGIDFSEATIIDYTSTINIPLDRSRRMRADSINALPDNEKRIVMRSDVIPGLNPGWYLDILKKDGTFTNVKFSDRILDPFSISPSDVTDSEDWARTSDGLIRAKVYNYIPFSGKAEKYIVLDFVPEKPELSIVAPTASTFRTSRVPSLQLAMKAEGATSIELVHESEISIDYYTLPANTSQVDMSHADETMVNLFTITGINKNGRKTSETISWGGEEFLRAYNTFNRLLVSSFADNKLSLELVTKNSKGDVVTDPKVVGLIRNFQLVNVYNTSIIKSGSVGDSSINLSTDDLPTGVYAIKVTDDKGEIYSNKFIKQ